MRQFILEQWIGKTPSALQNSKSLQLQSMLQYAKHTIPYYQKALALCTIPQHAVECTEAMKTYPLLTKDIIREQCAHMTCPEKRKGAYWNTSGGSTGEPIRILQDSEYLKCSRYLTYAQKKTTGFRWGMPWVKIWGNEQEILQGRQSFKGHVFDRIKNLHTLNAFRMSHKDKQQILNTLSKEKPALVVSYVQSLYELARFARHEHNRSFNIGAIIVSAGTLYPFMKEEIEAVFQAPVFNRYGSREVGNIAITSHDGSTMDITPGVWVEVVDSTGCVLPYGEKGELVITSLTNYSMPLIRYKIGDYGVLNQRPDGTVVLDNVTGRTVDLFKTPDGAVIDGEYFTHLMYFRSWVERFQFVQEALDRVVVKLVVCSTPPEEELHTIKEDTRRVMGAQCHVEFEFLEALPTPSSGKFRFTISHV